MMTNKSYAYKVDDNYVIVQNSNNASILFDVNTNDFYKFHYSDDLPKHILDNVKPTDLMNAIKKEDNRKISLNDLPSDVVEKIKLELPKPSLFIKQGDKARQLIDTKKKIEKYYKIKVNEDNKNQKYYFNYETKKYDLLDKFQLGILLEKDFNTILSEKDVTTIYGMLRDVTKPNNDAIAFNNLVLDTKTFGILPNDTFTIKKIPYNYIPINETKQNTLIEKTLKEILIPCNDSNKTDYYFDFLERIGASFKRVNKHKFIYMLQGNGNDGKGIILKILSMLYGDLAVSVKPSNFTDDFFATNLSDTNLILIDELNKNSFTPQVVDVLKDISGRGVRDVRIMRSQETIKAKDYGVIIIATNNVPNVPFNQLAYWKRLILVKMPNVFDETIEENSQENMQNNILKANENLEFQLEDDIDGIEWLISASIEAYKNKGSNFIITQTATATQLIAESKNPVSAFIDTYISQTNNYEDKLTNLEIKFHFLQWCIKNDITLKELDVISTKALSKEIGRVIGNKYPSVMQNKSKKAGIALYPGIILNIDKEKPTIEEIREKITTLEDIIFGNQE